MRLIQFVDRQGKRGVAAIGKTGARVVAGAATVYGLAREALAADATLAATVGRRPRGEAFDLSLALREGRLLPPVDHPDPAHLKISGTGLTHLGWQDRAEFAAALAANDPPTDAQRLLRLGLEDGRPEGGRLGARPEWFFKGDGAALVAPGAPIVVSDRSLAVGDEPEIAGLYIIAYDGTPHRLGFALGNEVTDHGLQRRNPIYNGHAKLCPCSLGPELLLGDLPREVKGVARILRDEEVLWQKPFRTGEAAMLHSIANLERHCFGQARLNRPGDVHVHYFGTATFSFQDGIVPRDGDRFSIEAEIFALPLENPLRVEAAAVPEVRIL